jgi:hypothetical protein
MSGAVSGPGWLLKHNGTTIAEVRDGSGPEQKADKDEVTNQSSGVYKEWIPTLIDGGDVTANTNYIPGNASQQALLAAMQARTLEDFTLTAPAPYSSEVIAFQAYVTDWDLKWPHGKHAELNIKLSVTGPITV